MKPEIFKVFYNYNCNFNICFGKIRIKPMHINPTIIDKISNLIMPDSVINLADLAIQNCDDLKNLTLPSSVDYNNRSISLLHY